MDKAKIEQDLKQALKARDSFKLDVLRMLVAGIRNKEIEKKGELDKDEILAVIKSEVKKRKDAIEAFDKGGRDDLRDKEQKELEFLNTYLPEQLGEDEIKKAVQEAIEQVGATGPSDIGKVMGVAMGKLKGQVDGTIVKDIVQSELS